MINLFLIKEAHVSQKSETTRIILDIFKSLYTALPEDVIDQDVSKISSHKFLEINLNAKNDLCCPISIAFEAPNVNVVIGIGNTTYVDNMTIINQVDILNLQASLEYLFYSPIEERIVYKNSKVLKSTALLIIGSTRVLSHINTNTFTASLYFHLGNVE